MQLKNNIELRSVGSYIDYEPTEKNNIAIHIKKSIVNQPKNEFEMKSVGNYGVMTITSQGNPFFHPIQDTVQFIENGGPWKLFDSYYEVEGSYAYAIKDGTFIKFTNFTGSIIEKDTFVSHGGRERESYKIKLKTDKGEIYTIDVLKTEWYKLSELIEKNYPSCQIYCDSLNKAYEKFKRIAGSWLSKKYTNKKIVEYWGWGPLSVNGTRIFYHGGRQDCISRKSFPTCKEQSSRNEIYFAALDSILNASELGVAGVLMLYALASYTDAPFTDAGFPLAHCMMIIGESGFLKTSFAREIFSPFLDYDKRIYSVRGTEASMNVLHEVAFDDTLVIDDYNMEGSKMQINHKTKVIQGLIRGYSDKTPRTKYGGDNNVKQYAMRGGCVFTAETQMIGQLKSGELRYIKVFAHKPFDKTRVAFLHNNPNIVPTFYAGYINYIEENYAEIVSYIKKEFMTNRTLLDIPEPRMKDAYIHLKITADILEKFLGESLMYESKGYINTIESLKISLYNMVNQQSVAAQISEPYIRYLEEVWNLIGTGTVKIADYLEEYVSRINNYIGYRENDLLIMKKDELYKAVIDAFSARNEWLPISIDEVSKKLKDEGLTKCDKDSCLIKTSSKIPGRPRMLAFIICECNKRIGGK